MSETARWHVIHLTKSEKNAEHITRVLQDEGLVARYVPVTKAADKSENYYEILCLPSEAAEAQQLLIERGLLI